MDLVFSGTTQGYFGPGAEQNTKNESDKQNHLFREYRGNPRSVLGIAKSEIIELPPPDKRRVHLAPVNYQNYPKSGDERYVFIVDEEGILVEHLILSGSYSTYTEMWLDDVLRVLVERKKQRQQ